MGEWKRYTSFLLAYVCLLTAFGAKAGSFWVRDNHLANGITHPQGYNGNGGEIVLNVCLAADSDFREEMKIPTQNAIRTWNALVPTNGNVQDGNFAPDYDYESVVLHELGHCIGLDHVNTGTDTSGVGGLDRDFSRSRAGSGGFQLDSGEDGVQGSGDDIRGDDENRSWFRIVNNDPFTIDTIVDGTTYSSLLEDLPAGHSYPANANRGVGALLGYPAQSEAVMRQTTDTNEIQRTLGYDDVAMIRLAMSGLDERQGTNDDYTLRLNFLEDGQPGTCHISVNITPAYTGFAKCFEDAFPSGNTPGHYRLNYTRIELNPREDLASGWFFNQISNEGDPDADGDGITDEIENASCTDALDADTDDDGLADGIEDSNRNGVQETGETDPCAVDSDNDGIQDGTESGITVAGVGTDVGVFIPDADPTSTTSPLLADSDGDNFSDGAEDLDADGEVDPGESDPNDADSTPLTVAKIPFLPPLLQVAASLLFAWLIFQFGFRRTTSS